MATPVDIKFDGSTRTVTGKHTPANPASATVLTDSTKDWVDNEWIGFTVYNLTTGKSAVVTDNNATTLTATIVSSWSHDDVYSISKSFAAPTITAKTVFGNKRITIGTLVVGNGFDVFPIEGVSLTKTQLGLREIEFISITGGNMVYKYNITNELVYGWVAGTANANAVLVLAADAVPNETVYFMAVGYGTR